MLQELTETQSSISMERLNLVLERERAAELEIDRVPAIVISSPHCSRIRFLGPPLGYELRSFVEALRITASGDSGLSDESRMRLASLRSVVRLQVFFTPSCVYCPPMVQLANRMAVAHPLISATAIDATEFPDLVRRYNVNGVPKTVINDTVELLGGATESELIEAIVGR